LVIVVLSCLWQRLMILVVSTLLFLMCVFLLIYYGCVLLVVSFTILRFIAVFYVCKYVSSNYTCVISSYTTSVALSPVRVRTALSSRFRFSLVTDICPNFHCVCKFWIFFRALIPLLPIWMEKNVSNEAVA
jgi:hypothetical protein